MLDAFCVGFRRMRILDEATSGEQRQGAAENGGGGAMRGPPASRRFGPSPAPSTGPGEKAPGDAVVGSPVTTRAPEFPTVAHQAAHRDAPPKPTSSNLCPPE